MAAAALGFLASCSATGDSQLVLGNPSFSGTSQSPLVASMETAAAEASSGTSETADASGTEMPPSVVDADDAVLPAEVAYVPVENPTETIGKVIDQTETASQPSGSVAATDTAKADTANTAQAADASQQPQKRGFFASLFSAQPQTNDQASAAGRRGDVGSSTQSSTVGSSTPAAPSAENSPAAPDGTVRTNEEAKAEDVAKATAPTEVKPTAYIENGPGPAPQQAATQKNRGFLASLFSAQPAEAEAAPVVKKTVAQSATESKATAAKPLVHLASVSTTQGTDRDDSALPGVRQDSLFEITRKSGMGNDDDVDLYEEPASVQVASAAGLARLAPNGLLKQTDSVDVGCLKPSLVRVLKTIERHYGKRLVVTSGYRNPERNRRARGARNSLHMYCAAADVQVTGVSKWELAKFVRSLPGRGGVGTYCHTNSVHVDVGPERDWNWRCRRRS